MPKFKKYLVYMWFDEYPGGGVLGDYRGDFETLDECLACLNEQGYMDGAEIVDRDTWEVTEPPYYTGVGYSLEPL